MFEHYSYSIRPCEKKKKSWQLHKKCKHEPTINLIPYPLNKNKSWLGDMPLKSNTQSNSNLLASIEWAAGVINPVFPDKWIQV